ncbi:MAG: hypothetical protein HOQ05_00165 [Corynebacteriales bacterium]|nr:hypothetical protein [Mycobacteriales bacterium]
MNTGRTQDRQPGKRPARGPALAQDIDLKELDSSVRSDLRVLPKELAELVGGHLVMATRLLDEDPALALEHAQVARDKASRLAVAREAAGVAAYHAGEWKIALSELRTARRMTGTDVYVPMIVDCERALGRLEKAQESARDALSGKVSATVKAELTIILAGMARDAGQLKEAADIVLSANPAQGPKEDYVARLRYVLGDIYEELGEREQARTWFERAADVDLHGITDAGDRVLELDGFAVVEDDES